ncbi:ArsA family ATPase [Citricoccus alkalitolerans]|uniref:ArsA family ATPase n=1 Tax=Citricoccus alkalitolerans TaxID=246603 RepID=A0ABV8XXR8_9MICC
MMTLTEILRGRRVVFFGGKGGVGKTTLSSATALALARAGQRVLVVSTDPAHNLGHLWERPVGDSEVTLWTGEGTELVSGTELDPDRVAHEHLAAVGRTVKGLMPEHLHREVDRYFELARQSPGTQEAALLEKMSTTVLEASERFDVVVLDTAPTGHTARLLELPTLMSAWTDGLLSRRKKAERFSDALKGLDGPRRRGRERSAQEVREGEIRKVLERRQRLFGDMRHLLADAATTAFVMVLTAERMPVQETLALHGQLRATGVDPAALVVNRRSPQDADEFMARRREAESGHLQVLAEGLQDVPMVELPLLSGEVTGLEAIGRFADLLV